MVNHYFSYGGVRSIDLGVKIESANNLASPSPRITKQEIPGRSGDLIIPEGGFENVEVSYNCFFKVDNPIYLPMRSSEIKAWLLSDYGQYKRLEDTYDQEYYREGYFTGAVDIEKKVRRFGKFEAKFSCKPYRYLKTGEGEVSVSKGSSLFNPEKVSSNPYIKIVGSGNITLSIGSDTWSFTGVDEYIEIDSETKNAYKEYASQNSKMSGEDFPELRPGKNNITWTGSVTAVYITPRWRAL